MKILPLFLLLLIICNLKAQDIIWQNKYKVQSWIGVVKAVETGNGGLLIAANSGNGPKDGSLIILQLNKNGTMEATTVIDTTDNAIPLCFKESRNGVYTLLYERMVLNAKGFRDSVYNILVEMDSSAHILFTEKMDPHAVLSNLYPTRNGSCILSGKLIDNISGNYTPDNEILLMEYDSQHRYLWKDTFDLGSSGEIEAVLEASDGRIMAGGWADSGRHKQSFSFLMRLGSNGKILSYQPDFSDTGSFSSVDYDAIIERKNGYYTLVNKQDFYNNFLVLNHLDTSASPYKHVSVFYYLPHTGNYCLTLSRDTTIYALWQDGLNERISLARFNISPYVETDWEMLLEKPRQGKDSGVFPTGIYYVGDLISTSDGGALALWLKYENDASLYRDPDSLMIIKISGAKVSGISYREEAPAASVYPNPVSDLLHVSYPVILPAENLSMDIIDMQGRLVAKMKLSGYTQDNVDVRNLQKGLYFYRIYSLKNGYSSGKFLKE